MSSGFHKMMFSSSCHGLVCDHEDGSLLSMFSIKGWTHQLQLTPEMGFRSKRNSSVYIDLTNWSYDAQVKTSVCYASIREKGMCFWMKKCFFAWPHTKEECVILRDDSQAAAKLEREEDFLFISCKHFGLLTGQILSQWPVLYCSVCRNDAR